MLCTTLLEQSALKLQDFSVFAVREAEEGAPWRFVRNTALEPEFVNTVAGPIAFALHDAIEAIEDLVRLSRALNCSGEGERT